MMEPIVIDTRKLYDYARQRGYEPLIDRQFAGINTTGIVRNRPYPGRKRTILPVLLGPLPAYMFGNDAAFAPIFGHVHFAHNDTRGAPGNGTRPAKRQHTLF